MKQLALVIVLLGALLSSANSPLVSKSTSIAVGPIALPAGIDAHDGDIHQFNGTYYLYGSSYGCGFAWTETSPYCGVRIYTSQDMVTWTDHGFAFDATTGFWQQWCHGDPALGGGCFEPRVMAIDGQYTMWLDSPLHGYYNNYTRGIAVLHSDSPLGPFSFATWDTLQGTWAEGIYYDAVGEGDIWYAVTTRFGDIVIQSRLGNRTIVSGSMGGYHIESPGLFHYGPFWYLTVSYPACAYCPGTGTGYYIGDWPLGVWTWHGLISARSCGGQPNGVMNLNGQLYEWIDQWYGQNNETNARIVLEPLVFNADGTIQALGC
jgi:hypothetical protein